MSEAGGATAESCNQMMKPCFSVENKSYLNVSLREHSNDDAADQIQLQICDQSPLGGGDPHFHRLYGFKVALAKG